MDIGTTDDIETPEHTNNLVGWPSSFRKILADWVPSCVFM
jgi:hypothetical protein